MLAFIVTATLLKSAFRSELTQEFYNYISKPDPSFHYEVDRNGDGADFNLTSQTWQGRPWKHKVVMHDFNTPLKKGLAVIFITGNGPNPNDRILMKAVNRAVQLPTAFLFSIPNEPLYGFSEDDLIAYTLDKYLETKDSSWPLLFPMTTSVLRTMDMIEKETQSSENPIHDFIISGASKRGWTTWFAGASGDSRVKAIAPMVIDNLNLGQQMKHQMEVWGKFSEQIEPYTKRGLQAKFVSKEGKHLGEIVDPYTYRNQIKMPTLVITGSNDPYWVADASSFYYPALKQPKWLVTVPNVGHNLGGGAEAIETFGAFCHAIAGKSGMPKERWELSQHNGVGSLKLKSGDVTLKKVTVWMAIREDFDFRLARYEAVAAKVMDHQNEVSIEFNLPHDKNVAVFGEAIYGDESTYRLCCPTRIFRRQKVKISFH